MSVTPNNIIAYGAANMPEADGVTTGGAVDFTKRVGFLDLASTMALDVVSSSASDTATKIQVSGRDSGGNIVTPTAITLTGTTLIASAFGGQSFERLEAAVITGGAIAGLSNPGGTAAVGDVALMGHTRLISGHTAQVGSANTSGTTPPLFKLQSGDGATVGGATFAGLAGIIRITGGTGAGQIRMITVPYASGTYGADIVAVNRDWTTLPDATSTYDVAYGMLFDILPNPVTAITRMFVGAQADIPGGSARSFYEKVFLVNTNAATALTAANVQIASDSPALPGAAALDIGLAAALNDTATISTRQTAPGSITFTTQPANVAVPTGSLPQGNSAAVAQAVWCRLDLPAGVSPYKGAADLRTTGSTT